MHSALNSSDFCVIQYHLMIMTLFLFFQFIKPPPKVPWKALLLAFFLFTVGTLLLIFGSLLFTGYFDVKVRRFCKVCEIFLIFLCVSIFLPNDDPL